MRPKATAAAARLSEIDPAVPVAAVVADLEPGNARAILAGHDLVFDGSDNFETRLLVSDASHRSACRRCTPRAWEKRAASP